MSPAAAERLIASSGPALSDGLLAERGLQLATNGFSGMPRKDVEELGRLFSRAYQTLAAGDREWMSVYVARLRGGLLTPEESTRGRRLMTAGVGALTEADRSKLRGLFEQAVLAGLRAEFLAAERTRMAAAAPPPPAANTDFWRQRPQPAEPPAAGPTLNFSAQQPNVPMLGARGAGPSANVGSVGRDNGEGYWRSRMQAARQRVSAAESR